ncbi:hypothetical protein CSB20_07145 [bacterium DOLZORAL124_64_63]|nr:MAG: hypothetical protein CSB20_07145 [bacterium DOLZORAL124_64_63]
MTFFRNSSRICRLRFAVGVFLLALILSMGGFAAGWTAPHESARVLMISSYSPSFPTFDDQVAGIRSVFGPAFVSFDYEFMDSKRFGEAGDRETFRRMLTRKLDRLPPYDCLLAADDNALAFLLAWGDSLQPGVPVVFFGVNSPRLADRAEARQGYTGVLESISMAPTLELMTRLRPQARRLVALADGTPTGQADLATFLRQAPDFPDYQFEVLSLANMDFEGFGQRLQTLGNDCNLLLIAAYSDTTGRRVMFPKALETVLSHTDQTVFHLWKHGVGDGLLGGVVISHEEQSRQAALMVLRVLAGEPIDAIPLLRESPNQTVVDYEIMQRFGLDRRRLPADTVFLNRPDRLLDRYRTPLLIFMLFMVLLVGGLLALAQMNRRLRLAQNRLRESELRYTSLFSGTHTVMLLVDVEDGHIIEANRAAGQFYGYPRDKMLTLRLKDLAEAPMQEDSLKKQPTHFFSRHLLASGQVRDVEVHAAPIFIGEKLMLYAIVHDITKRRRAEKERTELARRLQHVAKLEAIGNLAGGIAHDFNNFLTVIHGHADLLASSPHLYPGLQDSVQSILRTVGTAGDLVRKILDFSRPSEEELQLLDPIPVVRDSLRMLRTMFPDNVHIQEEIPDQAGPILAHPTQISQIVMNLGTNALHAMEATGGTLTVRLENVQRQALTPGGHPLPGTQEFLCLEFADTGHGIPEHIRDEIFNPYFTTKEYGKGSGLGLAILHGLIRGYEGTIEVTSEEGQGSTFSVFLPTNRTFAADPVTYS